jgi:DNA repair photolyase
VIEFDEETHNCYIILRPIIIGSGKTKRESLEDLREAAHFSVDTLITRELTRIRNDEESIE